MEFLQNAAITLLIFINTLVSGTLGFFHLSQPYVAPPGQTTATTTQGNSAQPIATTKGTIRMLNMFNMRLPGIPEFYIWFPALFGQPTLTHDSGLPELTFCKTNDCRDYYLRMSFSTTSVFVGQTLGMLAAKDIDITDHAKITYSLNSNGHPTLAQAASATSPVTLYYMEVNKDTVLEIVVGQPGPLGSKADTDFFRTIEDNIVRSIKFAN